MMALSLYVSRAIDADSEKLLKAAALSKTDLTTEMVKEFTELQGVVGGLYARAQGLPEEVAFAIYDHYKPVSMEDTIPRTLEGQALSLIDKVDTLVECFHVGLIPSGSKDPFALRRAAQGVIRILFEARLPLNLFEFLGEAAKESVLEPVEQPALVEFFRERISYYLRDVKGFPYDEVNAVLAVPFTTLADLSDRIEAIHQVRSSPDFEPLAASFKRIKNILKQAQASQLPPVDASLLAPGPESDLYRAFERVRGELAGTSGYLPKLQSIASLRPQVDLFFDKILVNDPNPAIRQNRLALLESLLTEFSTIADFSEIVTQGAGAQS
jgi:glycyl-tRNA synthetase beta chain